MKSILQNEKYCFLCNTTINLEDHHIYFSSLRKTSEKNGFKCWLCPEHHRGNRSPHMNREIDLTLKRACQRKFEETHTRAEFMAIIGRNYLD